MARTSTVVKGRFVRPGSSRTTPTAFRDRPGGGARRQIGAALRYLETRELGADEHPENRALFNMSVDVISRREARDDLARRVTPGVAYHSLVLSPGGQGDGMDAEQMREWTRRVMADLEKTWGGEVNWYGVVHQHTTHIHAHVIVAASREQADGTRRWTRFVRADYAAMRASGDRWAEHERASIRLLREAERYAADLVRTTLVLLDGGGGGRGPTDREEIERSLRSRR
jgi:hypothetical protein